MFKNLTVLRVADGQDVSLDELQQGLQRQPFVPCGATQTESVGWVPPRDDPGAALVESVAGHRLMRLRIETKRVPAAAVRRELQARCAHIETTEGRQPGRREQRELKEAILQELLPRAFASSADVWVWWDVRAGRLLLDTTTARRVDAVTSALVEALPGWRAEPLATATAPATAMAGWLVSDAADWPAHFAPGREAELKGDGDSPPVVRFARHVLQAEAMREHLAQGKRPTRLALDWDGRVQFVLTDTLQLRRIAFDDGVFESVEATEADRFDADAALATGELSSLLDDLIAALGGLRLTP